jgi:hypothetical protein
MKKFAESLKKAFPLIKDKKKIVLISVILGLLGLVYSRFLWQLFFLAVFIALGGISKLYHRFFRSTLGIDLVFFTTIMLSLVYRNLFFSLINAWLGLIIADTLAQKFSHTSIVSLIGLTFIVLIAGFMPFSLLISAVILDIIFELYSAIAYYFLGSSPDKIFIYFISHFLFNMFLIFTFAESLGMIMV